MWTLSDDVLQNWVHIGNFCAKGVSTIYVTAPLFRSVFHSFRSAIVYLVINSHARAQCPIPLHLDYVGLARLGPPVGPAGRYLAVTLISRGPAVRPQGCAGPSRA